MNSTEKKLQQKQFKMSIINELVHLSSEERGPRIDEIIKKEHQIPHSKKETLSRATIYRWLKTHKEDMLTGETLIRKKRSDAKSFRKLNEKQKQCITRWRHENSKRTCKDIRSELIENHVISEEEAPSISVIARYLKSLGMDRLTLSRNVDRKKVRTAFQADYPNQLWQIDTKGQDLKIQSKENPNVLEDIMPIVLLDDYSRYIVGVRYVYKHEENEETIMDLMMEAIERYGVPESLYTDRGGPYMGHALKKALNILGCRVLRTKPRDPASKGKCEKMMPMYTEKLDLEIRTKENYQQMRIQTINEYSQAVTNTYHNEKHTSTSQTPYERYLKYPGQFRRFVSEELLSLVFLPVNKCKVTKDNLIRLHKKKYLMAVVGYAGKFVEVRSMLLTTEVIHIWFDESYLGLAEEYRVDNDYLKKHQFATGTNSDDVTIPKKEDVPEFQALERKLQEYRKYQENKNFLNEEIQQLKKQRASVKSNLTQTSPSKALPNELLSKEEFTEDRCIHLFSALLRRVLSASERFSISRLFKQYGPFEESLVRSCIGKLLGQSCPTHSIEEYLDEIRLASTRKDKNGTKKQNT